MRRLIWVYTVCSRLSGRILKIDTVYENIEARADHEHFKLSDEMKGPAVHSNLDFPFRGVLVAEW